jgi:uncharacterized membrane protein YcaP (DUF421 family)
MGTWTIDWAELFVPSGSLLEVMVRGTVLYLSLFTMLRLLPRRQVGSVGVSDLLVLVLLADAAQNGMSGDYQSITEGVVLVATILAWNYLIDWLDHRFPALRINASGPLLLVRDGRMVRANMRREKVTMDELMRQLRQHGIEDIAAVKRAYVEGDGRISIIPADDSPAGPAPPDDSRPPT